MQAEDFNVDLGWCCRLRQAHPVRHIDSRCVTFMNGRVCESVALLPIARPTYGLDDVVAFGVLRVRKLLISDICYHVV
jgi:hypothetical protein